MSIKKIKKDFWEDIFKYPSFNIRFRWTLGLILLVFIAVGYYLLFQLKIADNVSDQIAIFNLIVQSATLVLGIFGAYYALRQLVETRFIGLDEAGMQELKRSHFPRAFEKWREAFYIRPEASVFINMCGSLLLMGDYITFDQYLHMSEDSGILKRKIFQETSDQISLLFLRALRHLLVKNQGEAEKYITSLVKLVKKESLLGFELDFLDFQRSLAYQNLSGECENIAENLISYLSKTIQPLRKKNFEKGDFASQVSEPLKTPLYEEFTPEEIESAGDSWIQNQVDIERGK